MCLCRAIGSLGCFNGDMGLTSTTAPHLSSSYCSSYLEWASLVLQGPEVLLALEPLATLDELERR